MKKSYILSFTFAAFQFCLFMSQTLMAQSDSTLVSDSTLYISWTKVKLRNTDHSHLSGYLYHVENDRVVILEKKLKNATWGPLNNPMNQLITTLPPEKISNILVMRNRNAPIYGAIIGAVSGAIIGFAAGSDPPEYWVSFTASEKALILGVTGAITGAIVGTIIYFTSRKLFRINGSPSHYRKFQNNLSQYTVFNGIHN